MRKTKKKILYTIVVLAIVGIILLLVWMKLTTVNEPKPDTRNYPKELDSIKILRADLSRNKQDQKVLKKLFVKNITEKIFPYWYGTKWDFNGTTQKPQEGAIACGYFVTTTLRDMGVPINRVKWRNVHPRK